MQKQNASISFTIFGEPASKANSRRLVRFGGRPAFIKSQKAIEYVASAQRQVSKLNCLLDGDLSISLKIFYKTRRPDLDESVILDVLQGIIYKNDRQVKEKHVYHALDSEHPRAEIIISKI